MMSALRPLRVAEFDDDVVDPGRETRVAYQTDAEPVTGFVAMRPFSERDHVVFGKRIQVDRRRNPDAEDGFWSTVFGQTGPVTESNVYERTHPGGCC